MCYINSRLTYITESVRR